MKPVDHVDPSKLTIGNDPLPAHRARANKYADLMAKLKPGQCTAQAHHRERTAVPGAQHEELRRRHGPGVADEERAQVEGGVK